MYKIRKRESTYYADISVGGQRIRKSTGTGNKLKAEDIARKWEAEIINHLALGSKVKKVWQEAVVRWLKENERKDKVTDLSRLKALSPHLINREIDSITPSTIWNAIDSVSVERVENAKPPLSNSTSNKYMGIVRAILRCCVDWEWLDKAPTFKKRKEIKKRVRWISVQEALTLIRFLPSHQQNPVRFALLTGLRKSNVYGLTWGQIDMQRKCAWIYGDQAKAGKDISIPLSREAVKVLRAQIGIDTEKVFPVEIEHRTFQRALEKAGIDDFRFHDLRHTWASWHVQNGTTLQELMELGGWHSYEMVLRYAHLKADHLTDCAEKLGTNMSQPENSLIEMDVSH